MEEEIGKRVMMLRKVKNMTQEELAKASGVNRITISYIESGRTKDILISTLRAISKALGTTVDFFLS